VIAGFTYLAWKESKEVVSDAPEDLSETSSGHAEIAGKKTSDEGHVVESNVREVRV
jgi:high-affinity iron transporter